MNKTIEEFEKWLLAQEKPPVKGEMTLGKINEYRSHMCKHAFEGGFNAAQALMSQGVASNGGEPVGYLKWVDKNTVKFVSKVQFHLHGANPLITEVPDIPLYTQQPIKE